MPYKDKSKNDACKRTYEEERKEEIAKKRSIRRKSPEYLAMQREKYNNTPEHRRKVRANTIKYELGITIEEYESRREAQRKSGDLCGLCKEPLGNVDSTPNLDHDHETMQIREFLHRSCNMAIGLLKDSPERCRLAAEYLERHGK
jgi:Recombination endonuclease VII